MSIPILTFLLEGGFNGTISISHCIVSYGHELPQDVFLGKEERSGVEHLLANPTLSRPMDINAHDELESIHFRGSILTKM